MKNVMSAHFDGYYDLPEAERFDLDAKTEKIKTLASDMQGYILEIGKQLSEVQSMLADHHKGTFVSWLKQEFGWSQRTAYNFMGVYEQFGSLSSSQFHMPMRYH